MPAAPSTIPVMWSLTSGSCTLLEDGCLTTPNFPDDHDGSSCNVSIHPEWTGVVFVEYMYAYLDTFHVDGELVPAGDGQQSGVHGMAPRSSLVWSPGYSWGAWKLCQVNALPPWRVAEGNCHIDREGCFVTAEFVHDSCFSDHCIVEFPEDWSGSLNVVEAQFNHGGTGWQENFPSILSVNGQSHVLTSSEDVFLAGVQGMVATGFTWRETGYACTWVKICLMESPKLPGPWGDEPWTCTALGDNCELPFVFNGVSFSACTQQLSGPVRRRPGRKPAQRAPAVSVVNWVFSVRSLQLRGRRGADLQHVQGLPSHGTCWACHLRALCSWTIQEPRRQWHSRQLRIVSTWKHLRVQVQLRARTACLACSMITIFLSVPLASLVSSVTVLG